MTGLFNVLVPWYRQISEDPELWKIRWKTVDTVQAVSAEDALQEALRNGHVAPVIEPALIGNSYGRQHSH